MEDQQGKRLNGIRPNLDDDPDPDDVELDELDQVVLHLRKIGRPLRLDRGRYLDAQCPVCRRSEVLVAIVDSREVILRCRDRLCERADLLAKYGVTSPTVQAESLEKAVEQRLRELIIDHHARRRFADWIAAQPQERL